MLEKPLTGWCVDASTRGNPGPSEYQCVDIESSEVVFNQRIGVATNNIAEYIAVGHAILLSIDSELNINIYTDSVTALSWIKSGDIKSNLKLSNNTATSLDFLNRIKDKLKRLIIKDVDGTELIINDSIHVKKWFTSEWGEIPADFGVKK